MFCVGHILSSIILHGILLKHVWIMLTSNLLQIGATTLATFYTWCEAKMGTFTYQAVSQTLDVQPPVPNWVNSSHSYILIGTCLQIKKIYDRVVKAAALCIFNSVNDCYLKICSKKGKTYKNYLYTQSKYFLLFCLCLQTNVFKNISMHISLPKKYILRCSIRAIHEKYVTLRYQINL